MQIILMWILKKMSHSCYGFVTNLQKHGLLFFVKKKESYVKHVRGYAGPGR